MSIANGTASTPDLHFVSKDIRLDAGGALKLDGSGVNLQGAVQLSQALSQQANPALVRVLQQDGKITLPAIVRGNAQNIPDRNRHQRHCETRDHQRGEDTGDTGREEGAWGVTATIAVGELAHPEPPTHQLTNSLIH
ncbi:MAG: hypothetical protein QM736_29640 [Vicinamibacterales bacterium]